MVLIVTLMMAFVASLLREGWCLISSSIAFPRLLAVSPVTDITIKYSLPCVQVFIYFHQIKLEDHYDSRWTISVVQYLQFDDKLVAYSNIKLLINYFRYQKVKANSVPKNWATLSHHESRVLDNKTAYHSYRMDPSPSYVSWRADSRGRGGLWTACQRAYNWRRTAALGHSDTAHWRHWAGRRGPLSWLGPTIGPHKS